MKLVNKVYANLDEKRLKQIQYLMYRKMSDVTNLSRVSSVTLNSTEMTLNLLSTYDLNKNGGAALKVGTGIAFNLPDSDLFDPYSELIVTALHIPIDSKLWKGYYPPQKGKDKVELLSDMIEIDCRVHKNPHISDSLTEKLSVKDLEEEITIEIPIPEGLKETDGLECAHYNTEKQSWDFVRQCSEAKVGHFACCTDHLSTFALVRRTVTTKEQSSGRAFVIFFIFMTLAMFVVTAALEYFS